MFVFTKLTVIKIKSMTKSAFRIIIVLFCIISVQKQCYRMAKYHKGEALKK